MYIGPIPNDRDAISRLLGTLVFLNDPIVSTRNVSTIFDRKSLISLIRQ